MTMRYAHLSPDVRRDAVKLVDVRESLRLTRTTSRGVVLHIARPQPASRHDTPTPVEYYPGKRSAGQMRGTSREVEPALHRTQTAPYRRTQVRR